MSDGRSGTLLIHSVGEYVNYVRKNHDVASTVEGQELAADIVLAMDSGVAAYQLRDLTDEDKAKCVAGILSQNQSAVVDTIGPAIRCYETSPMLGEIILPPANGKEWVNPLCNRIIKTMMFVNGNDYDDPPIAMPDDRANAILVSAGKLLAVESQIQLTDASLQSFSSMINERPADNYKRFVNRHEMKNVDVTAVSNARAQIDSQLNDNNSDLIQYLRQLPETDKIALMSALVSNDRQIIRDYLGKSPLAITGAVGAELGNISFFLPSDHVDFMNQTSRKMLQEMMVRPDGKLMGLEGANRLLTNALSRIHDVDIDLRTKMQIAKAVDPDASNLFVGYNEYVKPVAQSKTNGQISLKEFEQATAGNQADYSQFIMLSLGLLQKSAEKNPEVAAAVRQVRNDYMNIDYERSIEGLKALCTGSLQSQLGANASEGVRISTAIIDRAAQLTPENEVNIDTNYSRRFLENRVAALQFGNLDNYDSVNKVGKYFGGQDFENANDTSSVIRALTSIPEHEDENVLARKAELTKQYSGDYSKKGRHLKDDFYAQEEEPSLDDNKYVDSLFSSNPGVMRSHQPNYADELTEKSLRNPQPDVNTYTSSDEYYPLKYKRSAYVASISGHTYFMVAMLEKYMKDNPGPSLNADMNSFMQSFVATYVGRGYHSYLECVHVLQEEAVKNLFAEHGVEINLDLPERILNEAFKDSQAYTKTTVLSTSARDEMKSSIKNLLTAVSTGDVATVQSMLKSNAGMRHFMTENGESMVQIAKEAGNKAMVDALSQPAKPILAQTLAEPKPIANQSPAPVAIEPSVRIDEVKELRQMVGETLQHDVIANRMRGMDDDDKVQALAALFSRDTAEIQSSLSARIGLYEAKDIALLTTSLNVDPPSLTNPACTDIVSILMQKNNGEGNAEPLPAEQVQALLTKALEIAQPKNPSITPQSSSEYIQSRVATAATPAAPPAPDESSEPEPSSMRMRH